MSNKKRPTSTQHESDLFALQQKQLELEAIVAEMKRSLEGFETTLGDLNTRFGRLEVSAPPTLRAIDADTAAQIMDADAYAQFEVLADWSHAGQTLRAGRIVRADHYPWLRDWVSAGLLLGVPQNQSQLVERYKQDAKARAEAHREEVLARARAEAEASQVRLDAAERQS